MKQQNILEKSPTEELELEKGTYDVSRRKFFQLAGGLAGAGMFLASCSKNDNGTTTTTNGTVNLGSGDVGILNYAYALEQLEAAFYTQVVASTSFSTLFNSDEQKLLTDIRDHEVAHREFFKAAIGSSAIIGLTPDFSTIDFTTRGGILGAAQTFEDTGVAAYNGAGAYITSATYLTLAGKIVSVEARHSAYIRDLVAANSFATSADTTANNGGNMGLDPFLLPSQVLSAVQKYIKNTVSGSQLP